MSDKSRTTAKWAIETRHMSWGEWRASAIRLGSLEARIAITGVQNVKE